MHVDLFIRLFALLESEGLLSSSDPGTEYVLLPAAPTRRLSIAWDTAYFSDPSKVWMQLLRLFAATPEGALNASSVAGDPPPGLQPLSSQSLPQRGICARCVEAAGAVDLLLHAFYSERFGCHALIRTNREQIRHDGSSICRFWVQERSGSTICRIPSAAA